MNIGFCLFHIEKILMLYANSSVQDDIRSLQWIQTLKSLSDKNETLQSAFDVSMDNVVPYQNDDTAAQADLELNYSHRTCRPFSP